MVLIARKLRGTEACRHLREANERTRRRADDISGDDAELWTFFCECGDGECSSLVRMTLREFDELVATAAEPVLAVGHSQV